MSSGAMPIPVSVTLSTSDPFAFTRADVVTVPPDTSLEQILPATLEQPYPVPVVDEEGDFQGAVSRKSMISVLGEGNGSNDTG